ncbi:MAG: HAD hydrolase-like protein [Candidatus Moduliflexus flocculans]|nr:HAD hydrolase-like protein [Candidatus Moduliflexus flocculans]
MKLRGVIFDLDGTVVENDYDWPRIREELGTGGTSILAYLDSLEGPERSAKWAILESHEAAQTEASVLREGVRELLALLRVRGLSAALVTNNSRPNTEFLLEKFDLAFDCVVTRESGLWKPSGAPFFEVMRTLGLRAGRLRRRRGHPLRRPGRPRRRDRRHLPALRRARAVRRLPRRGLPGRRLPQGPPRIPAGRLRPPRGNGTNRGPRL